MCSVGLAGKTKRKFKATTHSKHNLAVTDKHLDRQFAGHQPNQVYAGDITTIYTQEGWRYWAVVIDLFSRQVVSGSMDGDMRATLVNGTLLMAIGKRKPDKGLLWRSDRGSQWAYSCHRQLLKRFASRQSMSCKRNCWANAV